MDTQPAIYFNPFDPEFRANPYPHYQSLLKIPPYRINTGFPIILVARYHDVERVLHDPDTFSSHQPERAPFHQLNLTGGARTLLTSDPPDHTRMRRLISREFSPRRVQALEPRIRQLTNTLLDAVAGQVTFDAMADLANQLPVQVIAEMLGVPVARHREFKHWSDAIIASTTVAPNLPRPQEALDAVQALHGFFGAEIARRRRDPGPDLVSALVASQEADALSQEELLGFLILLLIAGNETTTNLIGNGLLTLMRYPQELERLRHEPTMLGSAIEEMVRFDGPVQGTVRTTLRAGSVGGTEFGSGEGVLLLVAAANHDPAHFPDPERFDIARSPNEHLAFGDGIHFCIGAPLARLEGAIAIGAVLERFRNLRLAAPEQPLRYKGSLFLRGLEALPLAVE